MPAGEFAQRLQRAAGLGPELRDQRPFPFLVLAGHRLGQGQRGGDGEQLLLCAVVDVALDPPPLVVGGGDDPQPRGLQFGQPGAELPGQADVVQQQAGLGREVGHELALDRREILPRPFGQRQRAERFALVVNKRDPAGPGDRGRPAAGEPDPGRWLALRGPAGPGGKLGAVLQPHHRTVSAGTLGQDPGHPRERVLGGVGPPHPAGELAERLIRGGPLAEHQPVGQPLHPLPDRLERHRHHRGRQDRTGPGSAASPQARNRIRVSRSRRRPGRRQL